MIKGISFLRRAGSAVVYDRLASFFSALGFTPGRGWDEKTSRPNAKELSLSPQEAEAAFWGPLFSGPPATSRGASFLAPLGNLEFVDGEFPSTAEVLVEVERVRQLRKLLR